MRREGGEAADTTPLALAEDLRSLSLSPPGDKPKDKPLGCPKVLQEYYEGRKSPLFKTIAQIISLTLYIDFRIVNFLTKIGT